MGGFSVLVMSVSFITVLLLLLLLTAEAGRVAVETRATSQLDPTCNLPNPAVFVNPPNGTQHNSCWSEGQDQPCGSLPYAIQGAVQEGIPIVLSPGLYQANGSCVCDIMITHCNTWFQKEQGKCVCGDSASNAVRCDPETMSFELLSGYCMTHYNKTVVGFCPFQLGNHNQNIPVNPLEINEAMCAYLNRTGQLCGECKDGYYQPAYSYDLACVQCTYHPYNWVLYALAAFGPLTVFYIIILVFKINVASPPMTAFVQVCQIITTPSILHFMNFLFYFHPHFWMKWANNLAGTIYGIWNLDFFRMILPPICLPLNGLQLVALDYIIACYPIVLVIVTYVLIKLYDRNMRIVVWILKPFQVCITFLGLHQRDVKSSVISTFASFILLSYVKFLSVSSGLLAATRVYDMNRNSSLYLYNFPLIKYFGPIHLPYALTAIAVLLVFIVIPLLLVFLYPFRWFQCLLGYCRLHSHALKIFMDAFQGYLKDGTNGTRDYRQFAAAYLVLRIFGFLSFAITRSLLCWSLFSLFALAVVLVIVVLRPYKCSVYNTNDATLLLLLVLISITGLSLDFGRFLSLETTSFIATILGLFPLLWAVAAIMYWIIKKKYPWKLMGKIREQWRAYRGWYRNVRHSVQLNTDTCDELSHGPGCYQLIEQGENTEQT